MVSTEPIAAEMTRGKASYMWNEFAVLAIAAMPTFCASRSVGTFIENCSAVFIDTGAPNVPLSFSGS